MSQIKEFYQKDFIDNAVKVVLWTIGIVFLFLMFLTLFQCSLKKPSSPVWETDLILPLINKSYDMVTIIEEADEPSLYVDSLGELCFSYQVDLDTTRVEELLTFPHSSYQTKQNIGILKINPPESQVTEFVLTDIYQGEVGLVSSFSFVLDDNLEKINTFSSATLDQGKAFVSVENYLSLDLDSLKIDLIDDLSLQIIETVIFPEGLKDGAVDTQEVILDGHTISNQISYSIQAHTPGDTILSLSDKYLRLGFSFSESVFVSEALAQISEIQIEKTETHEIPTGDIIQSAIIKNGYLTLFISNHTNLSSDLKIEIPEFSFEGVPLSMNRFLLPRENVYQEIPLEHFIFKPASGRELNVNLNALTESTGTQQVWVSSSDSIVVEANLSQLSFSEVTKIPLPTFVQIESIEKEIDLPQGFDAAYLPHSSLSLEITNRVSLTGELHVQIKGDRGQALNLSGNIEAGSTPLPVKTVIIENDLTQFSNPLPSQITIDGDVSFGDGVTSTTITEEDFVIGKIIISSPLELILDSTQIQIDEGKDSLSENERELVSERLNNTKIVSTIENHLPLEARVELYLKTAPEVYTQPGLLIGPIELNSAEVDEDGKVVASTFSQDLTQLDKENLRIFESIPFYLGGKIFFPGTQGKEVKFRSSDYIKVSSYLEVKTRVGE